MGDMPVSCIDQEFAFGRVRTLFLFRVIYLKYAWGTYRMCLHVSWQVLLTEIKGEPRRKIFVCSLRIKTCAKGHTVNCSAPFALKVTCTHSVCLRWALSTLVFFCFFSALSPCFSESLPCRSRMRKCDRGFRWKSLAEPEIVCNRVVLHSNNTPGTPCKSNVRVY